MKTKQSSCGFLVFILILAFYTDQGNAQTHQVRLFGPGKPVVTGPGSAQTYDSATTDTIRRNVGTRFNNAATVCALGMWAFYNRTNYGEGFETTTSVTSVRGYDAGACASSSTFPAFKTTQSLQFLGNTNPATDGLDIYSIANFLGSAIKYTTAPSGANPTAVGGGGAGQVNSIRLGSFAITGTGKWRLCSDINTCVCIDMTQQRGGMYINRDVVADKSTDWPLFVRFVGFTTDSTVCQNDITPPANVASASSVNFFLGTSRKQTGSVLDIA